MYSRASIGGAIDHVLMLRMAFNNVSSLMLDRLACFASSSQVHSPGGGSGRAVGLRQGRGHTGLQPSIDGRAAQV